MKNFPSIRRLQMFEQLGRTLNFHQAAEEAGMAQPALSRGISQLEDEVGFKLFERTTRSTSLTPAGQVLHHRVQQWLHEMERSFRECRQLAAGNREELLLGYSAQASYGCMSQKLFQFGLRHPHVSLNLQLLSSEAAYEDIAGGTIHGAFALQDAERLAKLHLEAVPVETQRVVALCSHTHPLAQRHTAKVSELMQWGLAIGNESRWTIFRSKILPVLEEHAIPVRIAYEADDTPLLLEAIAQSEHIGLFGEGIVSQLPSSVVALSLDMEIELPICYVFRPGARKSARALAAFLALS
ncbi:MAG: LysR family transcriptional regulator [Ottowia sp.]|uniref:LysR substrate-binding domain-containing protein n=1 Tax=unclassified Ottowia TaxID=2645081 RepID=UPI003C2D51A5